MRNTASLFKLRANAPEGRKAISYLLFFFAAALFLTSSTGSEARADSYFPTASASGLSLQLTNGDIVVSWDKTLTGAVDVKYSSDLSSWTTLSHSNINGTFRHELANERTMPNPKAPPLVKIETVLVGDKGNAADSTGYGAVADVFAIGKYEVTVGQYTAFLNSVAKTDPHSLYNPHMASNLNIAGIMREGSYGSFSYSVIGSADQPISFVSWFDAARFANWMNNGATNGASTETGAYTLNGATSGVSFPKNAAATWWIPSEDEWYKAAYYKGGGTNAGYWLYPTESDSDPGNVVGGAANQANYNNGVYSATQDRTYYVSQNYLTDAGAFSGSGSAYGTFDQAGNLGEWNDAVIGSSRGIRGGSWSWYENELQSSYRTSAAPSFEGSLTGFRVASVPYAAARGYYRLRPAPSPPTAVKHLTIKPTGVGTLTVSWDAPSEGAATSYTVIMTTHPSNQGEATEEVFVTTTPSLTVGDLSPFDTFSFQVAASNSYGTGEKTLLSYSAETKFLDIASFTMNPTAMLAASDGSVWIGYEDSLVPTVVGNILNGVTQIPTPQNLPPQLRQYVLTDNVWEHQATIFTEGVSYGLTEDKNGDIWTANNTSHQSWWAHLTPNSHTTGVVQRITSTGGSYAIAETLEIAGGPLPETLITAPNGNLYVSVYGSGLENGVIQGIGVSNEPGINSWVFPTHFGPYLHPIVSLVAGVDNELWALESVPSGRFWDIPSELSTHSTIRRLDFNSNPADYYFKWVSPGASAIALLPKTDSTTSSVAIADHHRVLKVTFNGHHLKHDGDVRLEGQVKSFSFAADGALWVASRGKFGAIKETLILSAISTMEGIVGIPLEGRMSTELYVEVEQGLGNLPEPEETPGFIQKIWTPWQPFVAGEKIEFAPSTRMAAGVNAPLAAPISSGMWVRSANQPLFLPSKPFQPHGLTAVFGPGQGQITLAWEAPDVTGGAEVVGYSVTAAQGENVQSMSATGTSVTFDGLSLGDSTTYFTVSAINFFGEGNAASLFINKYGIPIPEKNTVVGMSTDGEVVLSNGYDKDLHNRRWGLDGFGNTYSYQAMESVTAAAWGGYSMRVGSTLPWNAVTFNLAEPNEPNFMWAAGQTIAVPQGDYNSLNLAGTGVNGSQQDQQITLTFTDGSSVVWTQSFSDWCSPQNYGHESIVSTQSYRNTASGGKDRINNYIYGYSYTIPVGKTLASITLPNNPNLRLLDVQMSNSTPVNLSGAYTSWGIANGEHQVANHEGFDGGGYYYYSGDLGSTIAWSGATFQLGPVPNSSDGQNNFVQAKGQTIDLPQGDYSWLYLAGAAANLQAPNQVIWGLEITLTFTDGSTATWTQSFTDWCTIYGPEPGEMIIQMQPNWVNQVGNVHSQTNYVFSYAYQIPAGKTLASITLPNNQNVGFLGMTMVGNTVPQQPYAIGLVTDGTPFFGGGFDSDGYAYSWEAMENAASGGMRVDSTLTWNGVTFDLADPNQPNFTWGDGQTIAVSQGDYNTLNLAGAGVNGSQQNQQITLTFTDGSSVVWTQSFSDWCSPQNYGHEAIISTQSYRNTASGGTEQFTNHIYGYSYTIPVGKTLASITLPNNPDLRLLDIQMSNSTPVNLSDAYTSWGIANGEHQVANHQGFDGGGYYYYSGDLESTIAWSGATFQFGPVPNSSNGQNNFVQAKGQTISMPQGGYGWLYLAGAAANGNQQNQQITLTFTDGSTATWTQSFSDWCGPQNYAGETIIQMQPNWVNQVGNVHSQTNYVFGYAYQIPAGKTLASITLPNNQNVGILGMTMAE
jgi:formylglycine-generating enzyme required for sulfatase activity